MSFALAFTSNKIDFTIALFYPSGADERRVDNDSASASARVQDAFEDPRSIINRSCTHMFTHSSHCETGSFVWVLIS